MRDPNSGWIQLSSSEFFLIWTALELGEPPEALGITHIGRTAQTRAVMMDEASGPLSERDLGTVRRPAADLAAMLRCLGQGTGSLDLRVFGSGSPLVGVGATSANGAAVAARVDGEIRVGSVREGALAESLLESLSPMQAGTGRPANVMVDDYRRACAEGVEDGVTGFTRVLADAGIRAPEVNTITQALTTRAGGGQLGASAPGRNGKPVRSPNVISWLDTPEGRYALRQHGDWITITPADNARLASMAAELLDEVRLD